MCTLANNTCVHVKHVCIWYTRFGQLRGLMVLPFFGYVNLYTQLKKLRKL